MSGDSLRRRIEALDGRGYPAYRSLSGTHRLGGLEVSVDRVQADPYAPPSLVRVRVPRHLAALPADLVDDRVGRIAVADLLTRTMASALRRATGTGRGAVSVGAPGQEILERTGVVLTPEHVEARLTVPLPASGRRIRGREAAELLTSTLPDIARSCLRLGGADGVVDPVELREHVTLLRDVTWLRSTLPDDGLLAFVADGAVLPRASGDSDLPLPGAVPFASPESLRVSYTLPSGRTLTGMGLPTGVTVLAGGGYHGKSTLLQALARGVYPHVPGDGREGVVTVADVMAVRAEDGRPVTGVDISAFIRHLPSGADTRSFSTQDASGSTSQAASVMEAVEAGATALLMDEDTSASNFLVRDERMRRLVAAEHEPITPLLERVRQLSDDLGVSTVLVAGGSGAFFDVADRVLVLQEYRVADASVRARDIAAELPHAPATPPGSLRSPAQRIPQDGTGSVHKRPRAHGLDAISVDGTDIDVRGLEQLVDPAQAAGVAAALLVLAQLLDGRTQLTRGVGQLEARLDRDGADALAPGRAHPGHLARPRGLEIQAAVNRLRSLRLTGRGNASE